MEFRTQIKVPPAKVLSLEARVVSLGSCFSENISKRIKNISTDCSNVLINPFGVLFNPISIAGILKGFEKSQIEKSILEKDQTYFSLLSHSSIKATSKEELMEELLAFQNELKSKLLNSNLLIITFGSAWYYYHLSKSMIVANCHKIPNKEFEKRMCSSSEIVDSYKQVFIELKEQNPHLNVLLTVSPVRHWKDGYRENTISKSNLHQAVHDLCKLEFCHYFPSYEIQLDELRDYRFYKEDMLHPSEQAVDFIWEKFRMACYGPSDQKVITEIEKINRFAQHKPSKVNEHKFKLKELKKNFIRTYKLNPWKD
jgi:hypothetical protein